MASATGSKKFRNRFRYEKDLWQQGCQRLAGVDEAGRGPLAGPVVAAAVIFPFSWAEEGLPSSLRGLNDSKQLTEEERETYFQVLMGLEGVIYGVGVVEPELIDQLNIVQATHRAMRHALDQLEPPPQHALIDGRPVDHLPCPHTAIVKGDAKSYSIAAASVIAKVTRDRMMTDYDRLYPQYGFAIHKGYGTPAHLAALEQHGACPIHRRTFAPLRPVELELFPLEETISHARPASMALS